MQTSSGRIRKMIQASFFAALTAVCAQLQIPLPMVPVNLALFSVFLCGALLGPMGGLAGMAAYVLMAAIGLPVMAGFTGGIGALLGPTGGYVVGYCFSALVTGLWAVRFGRRMSALLPGMALGLVACYLPGTLWFMVSTQTGFQAALSTCIFPFLAGDCLKILLAAVLTRRLSPALEKMLSRPSV